ncbi:MAG TPA: hypothetical protein VMH39_07770, partial [Gemmatimonadaceae bacterium]|nr:hypothetical protein [Gemmatimonadaceae bacterium]
MRILWHSNAPWTPSGYGQQTAVWVPRIAGLGHDVMISAPYNFTGSPLRWNGFTVLPGGLDPVGNDVLAGHYKLHRADLLITLCDLYAMDASVLTGMHAAHWMPIDCAPMGVGDQATLRDGGGVPIAVSRFGERQLGAAGFAPGYVPHGVDTALFRPPDDRDALRAGMGIGPGTFVVGMNGVNREDNRKAFPEQFAAFAAFHRRHENTRLMVHTLTNPPGAPDLAAIAADLGIADAVMFPDPHAYKSGLISGSMLAAWY